MKKLHFLMLFLLTPLFFWGQSKKINTTKSNIEWIGKKITGSHNGTIELQDGFIEINENGDIIKGAFTINMESLVCTDLQGSKKGYLEEHLKDEDFFNTKKYPTASFSITKCTHDTMYGTLTIKEISHHISFQYQKMNSSRYTATIIVDRTLFDIEYKSKTIFPLKYADNFIYDDFTINLNPIIFH